jgi:hypothetical protein
MILFIGHMGTMENGGGHGHHPQFLMSRQPSLPFMGQQPQPPASTDSGNPGSNLDVCISIVNYLFSKMPQF